MPDIYTRITDAPSQILMDLMAAAGRIGEDGATALKAEARRRVASGEYFGHAYMSLVARKPM